MPKRNLAASEAKAATASPCPDDAPVKKRLQTRVRARARSRESADGPDALDDAVPRSGTKRARSRSRSRSPSHASASSVPEAPSRAARGHQGHPSKRVRAASPPAADAAVPAAASHARKASRVAQRRMRSALWDAGVLYQALDTVAVRCREEDGEFFLALLNDDVFEDSDDAEVRVTWLEPAGDAFILGDDDAVDADTVLDRVRLRESADGVTFRMSSAEHERVLRVRDGSEEPGHRGTSVHGAHTSSSDRAMQAAQDTEARHKSSGAHARCVPAARNLPLMPCRLCACRLCMCRLLHLRARGMCASACPPRSQQARDAARLGPTPRR